METWINDVLNSQQSGFSVLMAVFVMGVLSVFTCACNFAIIGVLAGYTGTLGSGAKSKTIWLSGLYFLLGTVITMMIIGAIIGYASQIINNSFGNYWKIFAGIISIFFGLYSMDIVPIKIPGITLKQKNSAGGVLSAMIFGITIGGLASASSMCCNPFFPIVLTASFVKGSVFWGVLMLLTFALGYGLTLAASMVGVGLGFGKISKSMSKIGIVLKYLGGITMVALGFYFLISM